MRPVMVCPLATARQNISATKMEETDVNEECLL